MTNLRKLLAGELEFATKSGIANPWRFDGDVKSKVFKLANILRNSRLVEHTIAGMAKHGSTMHTTNPEVWTSRRLLKWMTDHFQSKQVDSPRVVAEMLLSHVLQCERMRLYMEADRPASNSERELLRDLVSRAAKHEPVQYLVGHAWFFSRQFEVNRSTLIPRPCTETLVEHVLQWHRLHPGHVQPLVADVGTGTGCIGITLAAQISDARVIATDIVPEALDLARKNAAKHRVADRMEFRLGNGVVPLKDGLSHSSFDMIVSNPPYIPDHEWETKVDRNVKEYEPATALRGGSDGLEVIRPLLDEAPTMLKPGGLLAIEIADCQHDQAIESASSSGLLENIFILKDHDGKWRVLTAERKTT